MKKAIFVSMSFVFYVTSLTWADLPTQLWVARYNDPSNSFDEPADLAVDSLGNTYVTGRSINGTYYDFVTIKYDQSGNELWVAQYDGPDNESDCAEAITVDGLGNVYITGYSDWGETSNDYVTIKYDSNGNELWVARYNGPTNQFDIASDLVVDQFGNVYVTGYSYNSTTKSDFTTIKYDQSGNELWVTTYNGPGNGQDEPAAIAIDSFGNIYITGKSEGDGTQYDYATVKYSPDGNQLWVVRYDLNAYPDKAKDLFLDEYGNIYVTGYSDGASSYSRYTTIKYDTNGNQLWLNNSFIHSGASDNYKVSMAVNDFGYVYITGTLIQVAGDSRYVIAKINPYGNTVWSTQYQGGTGYDYPTDLTVDDDDNIYVAGCSQGDGTQYDYATVKYDPNGNQLWAVRYDGPPNDADKAIALALDNFGNLYVTGSSKGWVNGNPTAYDYATIKYSLYDYCTGPISGDLNNDCKVNFVDFAILAENWLKCNLVNQGDCFY